MHVADLTPALLPLTPRVPLLAVGWLEGERSMAYLRLVARHGLTAT